MLRTHDYKQIRMEFDSIEECGWRQKKRAISTMLAAPES